MSFAASNREASPVTPRFARAGRVLPPHLRSNPNFLAAARHSRRVRIMRKAIPLICLAVLAFLGLRASLGLFLGPGGSAGVQSVAVRDNKIVMEKPRLSGFKRDGSSYEMNAVSATQELGNPNKMELQTLTARIQTGAEGGLTFQRCRQLRQQGRNARGARQCPDADRDRDQAHLMDANINFKANTVVIDKTARVKTNQGEVTSDRREVLEGGKKLIFEGNVRSTSVNSQAETAVSGPRNGTLP